MAVIRFAVLLRLALASTTYKMESITESQVGGIDTSRPSEAGNSYDGEFEDNQTYRVLQSGSTYTYHRALKTWQEAQDLCVSRGGNLATIQNTAENNDVHALTRGVNIWIGLKEVVFVTVWVWADLATDISSYNNWAASTSRWDTPKWAYMYAATGKWWYADCNTRVPYVCGYTVADFVEDVVEVVEDVAEDAAETYEDITETYEDFAESLSNSESEDNEIDDDDDKFERIDYGTEVLGGVFGATWVVNNLLWLLALKVFYKLKSQDESQTKPENVVRKAYNKCFMAWKYWIGAYIRWADLVSDIIYWITATFASNVIILLVVVQIGYLMFYIWIVHLTRGVWFATTTTEEFKAWKKRAGCCGRLCQCWAAQACVGYAMFGGIEYWSGWRILCGAKVNAALSKKAKAGFDILCDTAWTVPLVVLTVVNEAWMDSFSNAAILSVCIAGVDLTYHVLKLLWVLGYRPRCFKKCLDRIKKAAEKIQDGEIGLDGEDLVIELPKVPGKDVVSGLNQTMTSPPAGAEHVTKHLKTVPKNVWDK